MGCLCAGSAHLHGDAGVAVQPERSAAATRTRRPLPPRTQLLQTTHCRVSHTLAITSILTTF